MEKEKEKPCMEKMCCIQLSYYFVSFSLLFQVCELMPKLKSLSVIMDGFRRSFEYIQVQFP